MDRREKQRQIFVQLADKQLEPHGVTYTDVKSNPNWYMEYQTTTETESEFMEWGVNLMMEELDMSRNIAEKEMSWFILQWGLTTSGDQESEFESINFKDQEVG